MSFQCVPKSNLIGFALHRRPGAERARARLGLGIPKRHPLPNPLPNLLLLASRRGGRSGGGRLRELTPVAPVAGSAWKLAARSA